jgi:hypothetical protein
MHSTLLYNKEIKKIAFFYLSSTTCCQFQIVVDQEKSIMARIGAVTGKLTASDQRQVKFINNVLKLKLITYL